MFLRIKKKYRFELSRRTGPSCMHNTFRALCQIYSLFKLMTHPLRESGEEADIGQLPA